MNAEKVTRAKIVAETGIPDGSFKYWCNEAGVKPIGKPYQIPGENCMMYDYPANAIEKIKKVFGESKARRACRL